MGLNSHFSRGLRTSARLCDDVKVIQCPSFAESISEGDLRWEKAVGDSVTVDEVIGEIETDKTSVPVPSPVAGRIEALLVEDGATVSPGTELAKILVGASGGQASAPKAAAPEAAAPEPAAATPPPPAPAAEAAASAGPIPSTPPETPAIQTTPTSSTPASSVPPRAAEPAAAPKAPAAGAQPIVRMPPADPTKEIAGTRSEHRVKMNRMRLKIAQRLKEAQNTNAMLTTFNEIDMRHILK